MAWLRGLKGWRGLTPESGPSRKLSACGPRPPASWHGRVGVGMGVRGGSREVPARVNPCSFHCVPLPASRAPGRGGVQRGEHSQGLPSSRCQRSGPRSLQRSCRGALVPVSHLLTHLSGCSGRAAEKACPPAPAPRGSRTQGRGWLPPGPPPCPSITAPCVPASTTPSPSRLALRGVLWPGGCSALGAGVDAGAWREVPGRWPLSVAQRRSRGPGARLCC